MPPTPPIARRQESKRPGAIGDDRWARQEALADLFEAKWAPDGPQTIEGTLSAAAPNDRASLLRTLIMIDADERRRAGLEVSPSLYLGRFERLPTGDPGTWPQFGGEAATLTKREVAELIAPHPPTTVCPRDQTLDEATRAAGKSRLRSMEDPPVLPRHLRIDPAYGARGLLGFGGMGAVWAARDQRRTREEPEGRAVAVKVLLPQSAADSLLLARFAREAAILKRFGDPAIPRFREYRPPNPEWDAHILTDLIAGETFERVLESRRSLGRAGCDASGTGNGRLRMFRKAVAVVARAHRVGLIHRDLKPSNLMVSKSDARGRRRVYLLDFGMAWMPGLGLDPCDDDGTLTGTLSDDWKAVKDVPPTEGDRKLHDPEASEVETDHLGFTVVIDAEPANETETLAGDEFLPGGPQARPAGATRAYDVGTAPRTLIGSPPYMAPEQAQREHVGPAADVYALGLILVEILTGEQARDGAEAGAVVEKARSGDLAAAIDRLDNCAARTELIELALRCTQFDPVARPADAGEMLAELDALCVRDPRTGTRSWDPRTVRLVQVRPTRGRPAKRRGPTRSPVPTPRSTPGEWLRSAAKTLFGPPAETDVAHVARTPDRSPDRSRG